MALEVKMPKYGETMVEGTIVKWFKEEGEMIKKGEPLFSLITDKASLEVEAPVHGILKKIVVQEKTKVKIGTTIAIISNGNSKEEEIEQEEKEKIERGTTKKELDSRARVPVKGGKIKASPAAKHLAKKRGIDLWSLEPKKEGEALLLSDVQEALAQKKRITPVAEKMAIELGLDLDTISGTGYGGMITREDIEYSVQQSEEETTSSTDTGDGISLEGLRGIIAQRMTQSYQQAPHVTLTMKVHMKNIVEYRRVLLASSESRISFTDIMVLILSRTIERHPIVNSHFQDGKIYRKKEINIGLAVSVEEGLVVPVIRNANQLGLKLLEERRRDLVKRAREQRLTPEDLEGGTFTLTNLGSYGIEIFSPIINSPEAAILGMGAIKEEVVVVEGKMEIQPVMWLSLSFDHRVMDGVPAASFLSNIREFLIYPQRLLL